MRKNYVCLNAHSFHTKELNDSVVPYNIIIDVQVEYQIINPLIIYDKYGFAEGESVATSIISNSIHKRLSEIIIEKGVNLEYKDVYELLADYVKTVTLGELTYDDSKDDDIHRCWVYRWIFRSKYNATHRLFDREKSISICNIVITSFDKNLSLRTTI